MFKRFAVVAVALTLGAPVALAAGPTGPDFGPSAPDFGPGNIASTVIKHKIDEKTPDRPRGEKMGPSVCMSKVLSEAASGFDACKSEWSFGCVYGGFDTLSKAITFCTTDIRE